MDTLVEHYLATPNLFNFDCHGLAVNQKLNQVANSDHEFEDSPEDGGSSPVHDSSLSSSGGQGDPNDPMHKYISQMLMEEDELENKPCMFHDCSALLAAEKSFYDVLNEPKKSYPFISDQENANCPCEPKKTISFGSNGENAESPDGSNPTLTWASQCSNSPSDINDSVDQFGDVSLFVQSSCDNSASQFGPYLNLQSSTYTGSFLDAAREMDESLVNLFKVSASSLKNEMNWESGFLSHAHKLSYLDVKSKVKTSAVVEGNELDVLPSDSSKKKNHKREDNGSEDTSRSTKQFADCDEENVPLKIFDQVLLCPQLNRHMDQEPSSDDALKVEARNKLQQMEQSLGSSRGRSRGGRKSSTRKELVDLRSLLVQCAQAVATFDGMTTNELLKRIRQHSSANGDSMERLAHYFANALEARLDGTGTTMYSSFRARRITAVDFLKRYQMYIAACPFKRFSNFFVNRWIGKLASGATRLHIIDFGILYGFQWPCLIHQLSRKPGGPPKLRITGVDLPQPGLRPAERVEETGQRLERYCQRFDVPFEYNAIAKKWDTIQVENFKLRKDELLVVNCLDGLALIPDEMVLVDSPRDAVLNLIKRVHPDLFVQGVVNGTFNSPFFMTRFREALFHFSSLFDMFEATVPRESKEREFFEQEIFGRDALNVIACEGTERVDRPETYKQWHVRHLRARFKQLTLDREIMNWIRAKVKLHYHKDFSVDEDNNWMLQGWKGRVGHAVSFWVPR